MDVYINLWRGGGGGTQPKEQVEAKIQASQDYIHPKWAFFSKSRKGIELVNNAY